MNGEVMTEGALWPRAREGDGRAFAALFDLHRDRVFRHCLRLVEGAYDAEEITATAFFELWRRRGAVVLVGESVLPWLLVTAGNLARNSRRATRRYRALLDALPHTPDPGPARSDPDGAAALRSALAALAPVDQSLLVLVALEGYAITEAAALLGVTDGAARTRLHRAKARLRVILADGNGGSGFDDSTEGTP